MALNGAEPQVVGALGAAPRRGGRGACGSGKPTPPLLESSGWECGTPPALMGCWWTCARPPVLQQARPLPTWGIPGHPPVYSDLLLQRARHRVLKFARPRPMTTLSQDPNEHTWLVSRVVDQGGGVEKYSPRHPRRWAGQGLWLKKNQPKLKKCPIFGGAVRDHYWGSKNAL